jgi:excisionase family DNA binding protein
MKTQTQLSLETSLCLIPLQDVARMLSISRETLYRMIRRKQFPEPIKQGKRSYFSKADVDAYLSNLKRMH